MYRKQGGTAELSNFVPIGMKYAGSYFFAAIPGISGKWRRRGWWLYVWV